jgi:hypothetical protein
MSYSTPTGVGDRVSLRVDFSTNILLLWSKDKIILNQDFLDLKIDGKSQRFLNMILTIK